MYPYNWSPSDIWLDYNAWIFQTILERKHLSSTPNLATCHQIDQRWKELDQYTTRRLFFDVVTFVSKYDQASSFDWPGSCLKITTPSSKSFFLTDITMYPNVLTLSPKKKNPFWKGRPWCFQLFRRLISVPVRVQYHNLLRNQNVGTRITDKSTRG